MKRHVAFDDEPWRTYETHYDPRAWPADRTRWKTLVSAALTGAGDLLAGVAALDPGDVHLLHHHPDRSELYYVLRGSARVTVGDDDIRVRPGTAIYIPRGEQHRIENDGDEVFEIFYAFNQPASETGPFYVWDEPLA
jgi:oxalate decarboxylase/phosphoglucose isomerase-like protein (cupin superfamily)